MWGSRVNACIRICKVNVVAIVFNSDSIVVTCVMQFDAKINLKSLKCTQFKFYSVPRIDIIQNGTGFLH